MRPKGTVSGFQILCTLFVCRIVSFFTFIISSPDRFPAGERMLVFIPFTVLGLLASVPALTIAGGRERRTIFSFTDPLSPALSRICALLYAAGAVWGAAVGMARFGLYLGTVTFPGAELTLPVLLLLAAAVFAARRGTQAVVRLGVLVAALTVFSLIFTAITTADKFEPMNLEPPLPGSLLSLTGNGFAALARTGEAAALLVYAPRVRGDLKKGWTVWLMCVGLTASALFTWGLGVMGAFGERQTFQLHALTVLARAGVFERPDALIGAVWVLCAFVRLTFYLQTGAAFLAKGKPHAPDVKTLLALGAPAFALYYALSRSVTRFTAVLDSGVNEILFSVLLIGVPGAVYAAYKIKNRNRRAEA